MVWGWLCYGLARDISQVNLTDVRYSDEILRPVAVPFVQQHHLIFHQDNARPHVARICQDFLTNHNINPLDWPLYSPDLSPIEHLWNEMDRRVRGHRNAPATLDQLRAALLEEWENIPMRRINALMNSMHRRIRAVTDARGGHTRFDELIDFTLTYWEVLLNWFQLLMNY